MLDLIRDAPFGQIVRFVSGKRLFRYPEERDPSLREIYINAEKSERIARTGSTHTTSNETDSPPSRLHGYSPASSETQVDRELPINSASGAPVDPEKGRNLDIVDWYGLDDPEVSTLTRYSRVV